MNSKSNLLQVKGGGHEFKWSKNSTGTLESSQ